MRDGDSGSAADIVKGRGKPANQSRVENYGHLVFAHSSIADAVTLGKLER